MRHFFSLLTLAGLVGLLAVSCSKDDDDSIVVPDDPIVISENYFCFTGVIGDVVIAMNKYGDEAPAIQLQYSKDAMSWSVFSVDADSVSVSAGEKAYFRAEPEAVHTALAEGSSYNYFVMTTSNSGQVDVGGNIMTLLGDPQQAKNNSSLDDYAFYGLFMDCTCLRRASALLLPAMTLAKSCYCGMFYKCSSLVAAPMLPATTLAVSCYASMFSGCTRLETAPALPAMTLAQSCYYNMFSYCCSLAAAPVLPATTLEVACYEDMFYFCPLLGSVTMLATDVSADNALLKWLLNAGDNAFHTTDRTVTLAAATYADPARRAIIQSETPDYWVLGTETVNPDISDDYLCFTGVSGKVFITMQSTADDAPEVQLQYSNDAKVWSDFLVGLTSVPVSAGQKVYFRAASDAVHTTFATTTSAYNHFVMSTSDKGQVDVSGNIMTLTKNPLATKFIFTPYDYAFASLFEDCTCLRRASALVLPAMNLTAFCYFSMFKDCTSLETAPDLPATNLNHACYAHMFWGCTSLATAPALPAMTMANYCYSNMFQGCTSLETAPVLPATTMAENCYALMFQNCRNLKTAPVLPAATLAEACYTMMFINCTNLSAVTMLATDVSATDCLSQWLQGAGIGPSVTSRTLTIAADTYADSEKLAVVQAASPYWTITY